MKQMYEQAVAESERTGIKRDININKSDKAKVIKEKFERGEIINAENSDVDENNVNGSVNDDEDEMSVFEAGILYIYIFILFFVFKICIIINIIINNNN